MFTNVSIKLSSSRMRVHFDPPIPKVKHIELYPLHIGSGIPTNWKSNYIIFCSIIDEEKNYTDLGKNSNLGGGYSVSNQKKSKSFLYFPSFENSPMGAVGRKICPTKTDEFVSDFDIWITNLDGSKPNEEDERFKKTLNILHLCLKLWH